MSRPDLEAIRARCEAATPGPWTIEQFDGWRVLNADDEVVFDDGSASGEYAAACKPNNRDFFIAARADIPALLAYIELLTRERDEARAEVARLSRLENSLPASLRDAHVEVDQLRSQVTELTRERDEARAEVEKLFESARAAWEAECIMRGQRDEALAELAKESECADAAIEWQHRCHEARAEMERLRKGLEPIADGTVWNAKESAEFLLGRKP